MKLKTLSVLSMAALLCACSSGSKYETVEIEYLNPNRDKVISEVLQSKPIAKTEAQKIFDDPSTTIEVYYDDPVNDEYTIQVVNLSDYYFTGHVDFPECEKSISVKALPPKSGDFATFACPAFDADADFEYDGDLYDRTEEAAFDVEMDIYYFEEDNTVYDYVLDSDNVDAEMIRSLADYLYTESVLGNLEGTYNMYVFAKSDYDAGNYADEYIKAMIWLDQANDLAEIYANDGSLVERINYRK